MPDDLGRHSLAYFALGLGVDRQREVGMRLDVDEAGRDDLTLRVDRPAGGALVTWLDRDDASAANGDVRPPGRRAGAVDDVAAADDEIVGHGIAQSARLTGPGLASTPAPRAA